MLEESITSSPQKINSSIHKARIHRKNKRLRHDESVATLQENSDTKTSLKPNEVGDVQKRGPSLADLYVEDNLQKSIATFQFEGDFDPFEDELLLAVADRLDCVQIKKSPSRFGNLNTGKGFVSCSQFIEKDIETREMKDTSNSTTTLKSLIGDPNRNNKVPQVYSSTGTIAQTICTKTQFDVTESELLQCCKIAECQDQNLDRSTDEVLQTPQTKSHKSIVESILEDFCSSPMSPVEKHEHIGESAADNTPIFRFKGQPIRTYSRRRRVVFPKRFPSLDFQNIESPLHIDEEEVLSNCSSGLSVEENFTQPLNPLKSVDLNKTKLCENLLNLSAYFTQHSNDGDASVDSSQESKARKSPNKEYLFETKVKRIHQLISEISNLHRTYGTLSNYESSDEFYGFTSQHLNEKQQQGSLTMNNCIANIGGINNQFETDGEHIEQGTASELNNIFSESEEEWNDECDFFKNFKTQDAVHKIDTRNTKNRNFVSPIEKLIEISEKSSSSDMGMVRYMSQEISNNSNCFETTSLKEIRISAKVQQQTEIIFTNLPDIPKKSGRNIKADSELLKDDNTEQKLVALEENQFGTVDSFENIQLSEWPIEDTVEMKNLIKKPAEEIQFKGFQTASNKAIEISDDAKLKAAHLLENLPDLPYQIESDATEINENDDSILTISKGQDSIKENEFKGFQTASKKSIKISDSAKVIAQKILENLPDLSYRKSSGLRESSDVQNIVPNSMYDDEFSKLNANTKEKSKKDFAGFCTASKKSIQISEEAKLTAKRILSSLPEIPTSKSKVSNEEQLSNIQLSEWPLDKEIEIPDDQQINQTPSSAKRKLNQETSPAEQIAKILCNTNDVLTTPLTTRTENCLQKSVSFGIISENISIVQIAKSELIARKNRLSLSKRRKSCSSQEINMPDANDTAAAVKTPLKSLCHSGSVHMPGTPNLKEFIEFIPNASTPCTSKMNYFKNAKQQELHANEIDSDFQHIRWEECNESNSENAAVSGVNLNNSNLSDSTRANVTLNKSNPPPKQRIDRLRMYGEPPPVSPILILSKYNCRPSGLRRGRSITKK